MKNFIYFCVLSVSICCLSLMARMWWGYPNCPCDENNWVFIAEQLALGNEWPVSGPFFLSVIRLLVENSSMGYIQALAWVGLLSVPVALLGLFALYRLMGVVRPDLALLMLSTSSYFWAPLLECRPQQLGQILTALGIVTGVRYLTSDKTAWKFLLGWTVIVTLTMGMHILSAGVLFGVAGIVSVLLFVLKLTRPGRLGLLAAGALPALAILLYPNGPYNAMIKDIVHNHILLPGASLPGFSATVTVAAVTGVIGFGFIVWGVFKTIPAVKGCGDFLFVLLRWAKKRRYLCSVLIVVICGLILGGQAAILPGEAWHPYGGSMMLFWFSQAGNLFFLLMIVSGITDFEQVFSNKSLPDAGKLWILQTVSIGLLAILFLILSLFLIHTNWMLRLINYGILFIVPLGAAVLQAMWRAPFSERSGRLGIILVACVLASAIISYLSALRVPFLFHC